MSEAGSDTDELAERVEELSSTVETLERELRRPRRRRRRLGPPSAAELRQFTSEVAIPGLILLLEANVRALKLFQRTLRLSDDRDRATSQTEDLARQASAAGSTALARLEDSLADVQSALEGEPTDSEARELLADARRLRGDIEEQLDTASERETADDDSPEVDVEAELQSIKDRMEDDGEDTGN